MSKYRCFISKKEEEKLPEIVQNELQFLRKRLKDADDLSYYHLCCRLGDDPPKRLYNKFDKLWSSI